MEEGFDHLRCPMCGGELMYSEGTHDLCCRNNPYEIANSDELQASERELGNVAQKAGGSAGNKTALHERGAGYLTEGEEKRNGFTAADIPQNHILSKAPESEKQVESGNVAANDEKSDGIPVKRHTCAFAVSFTESGRYGTLWSVRTVHDKTNYFALIRMMRDIEKRQRDGEPLAANIPNLPRKTEKSAVSKLAFRYSIEVEDLYSIRYSSETADRLAAFYGLTVRDIRHIKSTDIPEGE